MRIRSVSLLIAVVAALVCGQAAFAEDPVNIAPDAAASGSPSFSGSYPVSRMIDELFVYPSNTYVAEAGNGYFQLDWATDVTFDTIKLYNLEYAGFASSYNLVDFDIYVGGTTDINGVLTGGTLIESPRGGTDAIYTYVSSTPITTSKLYFDVITANNEYGYARVVELEVMSAEVPEPMTLSLLALGGLGILRRRR